MLAEELETVGIEQYPYLMRVYGVTEEEYERITTEDTKYELVDRVLIMHSPASIAHEELFGFLQSLLNCYVRRRRLGKVLGSRATLHLATCRKLEPGLLFVSNANLGRVSRKQVEGTTDLVLELLSVSTRDYDFDEKRPLYREAGVREIWLVDPDRHELVVDRLRGETYQEARYTEGRVESLAVPAFWMDVAWLWSDPLPDPLTCLSAILGEA